MLTKFNFLKEIFKKKNRAISSAYFATKSEARAFAHRAHKKNGVNAALRNAMSNPYVGAQGGAVAKLGKD